MSELGFWSSHDRTSYRRSDSMSLGPGESERLELPAPRELAITLSEALLERRSCREFSATPLTDADVADLLYYGYGSSVGLERGRAWNEWTEPRLVPSAGASYALDLQMLALSVSGLDEGRYLYDSRTHSLVHSGDAVSGDELQHVLLDQPYVADPGVAILISIARERVPMHYGHRGYRYLLLEAGHVAQNINLVAAGLGLGVLNVGGFYDSELASVLRLTDQQVPLYVVVVGHSDPGA